MANLKVKLQRALHMMDVEFVSTTPSGMADLHHAVSDLGLKLKGVRTSHEYRPLVDTVYITKVWCMPADLEILHQQGFC